MEIQELKFHIENCPRVKDGRLKLSKELRSMIVEVFNDAGLGTKAFAEATGLSLITIYKLRKRADQKFGLRAKAKRARSMFKEVLITPQKIGYQVIGPQGLRIEMGSVEDLSKLWRALC